MTTAPQCTDHAFAYLRHMPVGVQIFLGMITTIKSCLICFYFLASCFMILIPNQPLPFVGEKDICKIDDSLISLPSLYAEINKKKRNFNSLKFFTQTKSLPALYFTHFIACERLWTYKFPI